MTKQLLKHARLTISLGLQKYTILMALQCQIEARLLHLPQTSTSVFQCLQIQPSSPLDDRILRSRWLPFSLQWIWDMSYQKKMVDLQSLHPTPLQHSHRGKGSFPLLRVLGPQHQSQEDCSTLTSAHLLSDVLLLAALLPLFRACWHAGAKADYHQ